MRFGKWSGLGNDFVIVESEAGVDAVRWCDRRKGIGADGVVIVTPLGGVDFKMRIINSDGSEAAMCGNASRCVAKYILSHGLGKGRSFALHTLSGIVQTVVHDDGTVTVDMGPARPFLGSIRLAAGGRKFTAETVSMGNPHAVIFVDDIAAVELEKWGPVLEHDPQFPDRCNIEFAQMLAPDRIRMRVWERGCGVTAACGTGSCATLVAAQKCRNAAVRAEIVLDGGSLFIERENGGRVFMTGSADEIFTGEIH
jgi:diaminopimelate epimerase